MNEKQKKYALIAGAGLLALFLIYRYYSASKGNSTSAGGTGTVAAPDTSGSDYATMAGQEQGDVAALQSQEQSDVAGLTSDVGAVQTGLSNLTGQEQTDLGGVTSQVSGLAGQIQSMADLQSTLQGQVASIAVGTRTVSPATVATHKGGPFYNYYVRVTGKAPPRNISTGNFVYEAWKAGVSSAALAPKKPVKHPSSNNTHIAHPNGNHQPTKGTTHPHQTKTKTAPHHAKTPTVRKPAPKQPKRKPPAKTRPKASTPRK